MGSNALTVSGLTKRYSGFTLDHISFEVPSGTIVGLVGENGAGKSTAIRAILGMIQMDSGTVSILGSAQPDNKIREQIGVVLDTGGFPEVLTAHQLNQIMKNIYHTWDEQKYSELLQQFALPPEKKIQQLSKGMRMKLSIAAALSHHPRLLILDEATSGLDPVVRDDILDLLLDFVQDESHSILVSSHITSDLEKAADYIVFIHRGNVLFSKAKDELLERYGILKCGAEQFSKIDRQDIIRFRRQDYEYQVLVSDRSAICKKYPDVMLMPASIDEIMLLYIKGDVQ